MISHLRSDELLSRLAKLGVIPKHTYELTIVAESRDPVRIRIKTLADHAFIDAIVGANTPGDTDAPPEGVG